LTARVEWRGKERRGPAKNPSPWVLTSRRTPRGSAALLWQGRAAAVTSWAHERKGERTVTGDGEKRDRRRTTVGPEWIGKNKRAPQSRTGRAALPHRKRHCCTSPERTDLATI
jgi:hypothetical protein